MEMTKEIMHEQFKKLKSNDEKVKYLVDLKEIKQKSPHVFRNIKINIKQFSIILSKNIRVSNLLVQCIEMIAEREDAEKEKRN